MFVATANIPGSTTEHPAPTQGRFPVPQWWLQSGSHIIAGALVVLGDSNAEAQIHLDGRLLYRSRHTTRAHAEQELAALRGRWTGAAWIEEPQVTEPL